MSNKRLLNRYESIFCIIGGIFGMNFSTIILLLLGDKYVPTYQMISSLFVAGNTQSAATLISISVAGLFCVIMGIINLVRKH